MIKMLKEGLKGKADLLLMIEAIGFSALIAIVWCLLAVISALQWAGLS